ncbi:MAG: sn-glycerol-3-phosphate ABC transporter ATP-binding protein UgpC [Bauldia sp.]|uniref:ABC transporter ATP-binding protein n=1 Tax=Bauldia sp. TaxID=2575872 RepID=UPI001D252EB4|nr:sn-glycerol-3-phosphate ABC transporter ATP-binding protein UgpC [Bauldia sp.]MCB1495861.1 sn-glycerol-3-phosphate ABC transporter ATP-binding protein UgpC [Bauldia sp.]
MAQIKIRNLIKQFGDVEILHNLSFDIEDKELVALVGPSGCGKTTLLRMIAGLEEVTQGDIVIDDKIVNRVREKDRDIAMVFQSYALYPHMTVRENMAFALRMRKMPKEEQERRISWAADILALTDYLERYPRQLSGGQRQRVAMGRALVREPAAFLLDEPLSNLDAQLRVQMRTELRALHQRLKATMVYVTHDQIEAMTLADKIVVMRDGYVEQIGAPDRIYDRPANTFVAKFIGSPQMNMLSGVLRRADGGVLVEFSDGHRVEVPGSQDGEDGTKVLFGIRPEDLQLSSEGDGLPMTVEVVEFTGREVELFGARDDERICVLVRERTGLKPDETVWLKPNVERAHVFDADSGRSLYVN